MHSDIDGNDSALHEIADAGPAVHAAPLPPASDRAGVQYHPVSVSQNPISTLDDTHLRPTLLACGRVLYFFSPSRRKARVECHPRVRPTFGRGNRRAPITGFQPNPDRLGPITLLETESTSRVIEETKSR